MNPQVDSPLVSASPELWNQRVRPDAMKDVSLRHLKTRREVEAILHMREGIDLSALTGDRGFLTLEKKEMRVASSSGSTSTASS